MQEQKHRTGDALKTLRTMANLTLKEVAVGAGTASAYLSKVENGTYLPSLQYVARVSAFISQHVLEGPTSSDEAEVPR